MLADRQKWLRGLWLRGLRRWLGLRGADERPEIRRTAATPLALNLGIDFGTSFTKIAFRDLSEEATSIVTFGAQSAEGAMLPSIVRVSRTGDLFLGSSRVTRTDDIEICFLKMRLADVALPERPPTMAARIPELDCIDFSSKEGICALSSWFLATVILRAQQWILQHETARTKGRIIQWSANIGVPVEYFDSPAIGVFREVLTIAWAWVRDDEIPTQIDTLVARYRETRKGTTPEASDCHVVAEIAAAVQSFVTSREAVPGVYVYFDIGGGTLDGVAFNFVNWQGERRINFYSGRVAPLGIAAIMGRFRDVQANGVEALLSNAELASMQHKLLKPVQKDIQLLVANVVMTAKRKDGRDWQRNPIQNTSRFRKKIGCLTPENMTPLLVFVGGGGAGSKWYQSAILSTHQDFRGGRENLDSGISGFSA